MQLQLTLGLKYILHVGSHFRLTVRRRWRYCLPLAACGPSDRQCSFDWLSKHWLHIFAFPLTSVSAQPRVLHKFCGSDLRRKGLSCPPLVGSEVRGRVRLLMPELIVCSANTLARPVPNLRNTRLHVMRSSIGINKKLVINIRVSKASSNDCPHRIKVKTTTSAPPTNLLCGMTRPRQGLCWQMRAHRLMVCAELRHLSPSPLTFSRSVPFLELSPT